MGPISWIILGGLAGWVASMVMKTDAQMGVFANVIVGIIGAVIGGWIMAVFGNGGITGFNLSSFLVALLGAVVLLWLVKMFRRA